MNFRVFRVGKMIRFHQPSLVFCWLYIYIYSWTPGSGNCLQRLTFDQAEQSEATEDGFQRIREVTGLTDVMDIVHKLLGQKKTQLQTTKQKKTGVCCC